MSPTADDFSVPGAPARRHAQDTARSATSAVVYCEGQFGEQDGKTANGLVRHSERYEIVAVIDSERAGSDAGAFLDGVANGIPVSYTHLTLPTNREV